MTTSKSLDEQQPVTRAEFEALRARVDKLDGNLPPAPAEPLAQAPARVRQEQPEPEIPSITLSKVDVKVAGDRYQLRAVATASSDIRVGHLQIAVDGARSDVGFVHGVDLKAGVPVTVQGEGSGAGTFTTYLTYSQDSAFWMTGPKTQFTIRASAVPARAKPQPAPQTRPGKATAPAEEDGGRD